MSSCPGTRDLGQLTRESVPLPDFGGMYERCVRYSGLGGRADQTRVDLTLPALGTTYFEDALSYTNRGLIDTQQFPESWSCPPGGPCGFLPGGGSHSEYDRGVMTGSTFGGTSSVASSLVEKWAPSGAPTRVLFGNGVRRVVELDELERPARISVEDAVGAMLWDSGLTTYDGLGNILAIGMDAAVPGTHPQAFTYDAQMRLASASLTLPTTLSVTDVQYSYDGLGNMTDRVGTPWPSPTEGGFTARAHFDATTLGHDNRVHDAGWNYDSSGNLVSEPGGRQYSWDAQGRMRSVNQGAMSLGTYAYDAGGERLLRQDASGLTFTYRGGAATARAMTASRSASSLPPTTPRSAPTSPHSRRLISSGSSTRASACRRFGSPPRRVVVSRRLAPSQPISSLARQRRFRRQPACRREPPPTGGCIHHVWPVSARVSEPFGVRECADHAVRATRN